jgi:hypothetical protein
MMVTAKVTRTSPCGSFAREWAVAEFPTLEALGRIEHEARCGFYAYALDAARLEVPLGSFATADAAARALAAFRFPAVVS